MKENLIIDIINPPRLFNFLKKCFDIRNEKLQHTVKVITGIYAGG